MIEFPGHTLVIGATGAGKGVICHSYHEKWLAADAGHKVYLLCNKQNEYDRYKDHPRLFKTGDQFRFLEEVRGLKSPAEGYCDTMVIIDEAFDWDWKKKKEGLQYIPNAARAHGVFMWVTSQFPTQMAPTVRANCDNIYCFKQRPNGAAWTAKEYEPEFIRASKLPDGYFIHQAGTGRPVIGCAWRKVNGVFERA